MKLNPDDPRLTAYALGELNADERAEIETALRENPECRRAVEEIRQTAAMLSGNFAKESSPKLSQEQRNAIEEQLHSGKIIVFQGRRIFSTAGIAAIAASVMFLIAWQFDFFGWHGRTEKMAGKTESVRRLELQAGNGDKTKTRIAEELKPAAEANRPPNSSVIQKENNPTFSENSFSGASNRKTENIAVLDKMVPPAPVAAPAESPATVREKKDVLSSNVADKNRVNPTTASPANSIFLNAGQLSGDVFMPGANSEIQPVSTGEALSFNQTMAENSVENSLLGIVKGFGGGVGGNSVGSPAQTSSSVVIRPTPAFQNQIAAAGEVTSDSTPRGIYDDDVKQKLSRFFRLQTQSEITGNSETATYPHLEDNSFLTARNHPLSTFSIDVDTASYANVRRFLNEGRMPPRDAVRIEELINYFHYDYPQPRGDAPFSANIEIAGCPWNPEHRLVRIGLKGREVARGKRPPSNFVFLIDVSGSMAPRERLPLIKQALRELVKKMTENDRVAIVVYASEAGLKLESTSCADKEKILQAIDDLGAGGSTNGGDGIRQAYRVAENNFIKGGVNRVLLCTDGDFNVGMTDQNELVRMIQQKARSGVFLTTLGVGTDNYKDALMQKLADKGNGNYFYLDSLEEAQKVLIDQMNGTLVTIAKDVKIQIEFNPATVNAYRLIGYEKRLLRKEDFNNDAKDAGEIGAGHTVTALYEIVPAGREIRGAVDDLKYQESPMSNVQSPMSKEEKAERYASDSSKELLTLKLRYKQPDGKTSTRLEFPVTDKGGRFSRASKDFQFAASVAEFGMLLRDSEFKGDSSYDNVLEIARASKGADENGYRAEFLNLVKKAKELDRGAR
ncbi:MAG TPA: von Willebrand factor type A domain-containing protein [Verrucomicrobiae bacterium]|nr:von Willebrand factor type A domain-containing protein [Verrucomicrobiae bacterium]